MRVENARDLCISLLYLCMHCIANSEEVIEVSAEALDTIHRIYTYYTTLGEPSIFVFMFPL